MSNIRLPIALQQAVMRRLRESLAQANAGLKTDYPEPKISYQQRGTAAGTAHMSDWEIRLNARLLAENGQQFIDEVIPHELAHLLVYRQFKRAAPHGAQWRYMMEQILQVPANRTHRFSVESVQGTTFAYLCSCQEHLLTVRRHNRIVRGETEYRCRHCKELLKLSAELT